MDVGMSSIHTGLQSTQTERNYSSNNNGEQLRCTNKGQHHMHLSIDIQYPLEGLAMDRNYLCNT